MPSFQAFVTEAFTLLGFAVLMVFLRTIGRGTSVGVKNFQLDDYLMVVACIAYGIETGLAYVVGAWWHGLANSGMTPEQRAALDPASEEYHLRVGGSKTQLIGWSTYTLILWLIKLCQCVFYSRITEGLHHMRLRVRIGYAAIGVTYAATILSILLGCQPFHHNWQINPDPGNNCQPAISKIDCLVTVVLNVITDAYLISIPLPLLWRSQLALKKKLLLMAVFSGGIFVMACGILRCVLILIDPINGAQQAGSWAVRETFVAIIISNVPMVYHLFMRLFKAVDGSLATYYQNRSGYARSNGNTYVNSNQSMGSYALRSREKDRKKFIHPLSMRNVTASNSTEGIITETETEKKKGVIHVTREVMTTEDRHNMKHEPDSIDHVVHWDGVARSPEQERGYAVTIDAETGTYDSRF